MNGRAAGWRWAAPLLLAPLFVLAFQDNPLFTSPERLDSWMYLGFFRDLVAYKRNLFPNTYYGSRLPFLLPGAALHSLFGTVTAGAILHLLVHSVATLSLFFAAEPVAGRRAAFVTSFLFSVHPWVWFATGWDNPDGAAMAYFALSMALVAAGSRAADPRRWLAGAGIAAAAAVYSNIFLVLFVAFVPLHWAGLRPGRDWRVVAIPAGWMLGGAAALTGVLAAVNRWIDGTWNFYAPSVRFVVERGQTTSNPEPAWGPGGLQPWLWFAAAAAIVTLVRLPRRRHHPAALILSAHFLLCGVLMSVLQAAGPTVLGLHYYASYLLPLTFLSIAIWFGPGLDTLGPRAFAGAIALVAAAALTMSADPAGRVLPFWPDLRLAAVAVFALLLAAGLYLAPRPAAVWAALAGWVLLTAYVRVKMPADPHAWRKDYTTIAGALERISQARGGRPVSFLLDERGVPDGAYMSLASTYLYGYSIAGRRLPEDACREVPDPAEIEVVVSRRPDAAAVAQSALAACWSQAGLVPRAEATVPIPLSYDPFTAILFRAEPDPARWRALRAAADGSLALASSPGPLPLHHWRVWVHPHDRGILRQEGNGVWAITPKGADYAFRYDPVPVPVEGRYRFTLRYTPREGAIAFGAYRRSDLAWRSVRTRAHPVGDDRELSFLLDLHAGESVDLLISNNRTPDSRRATAVLKELTAGVLQPAAR
jgi:hypothetical protein